MRRAHSHLLWLLHIVMAWIVLLAYLVLRRSLRPLRALHEGVARLSEGELDVTVPSRMRDEIGALAEAFNQMVGRISEMLRARDQLLLDVSHELRSPLTRVKVALALLPEGDKRRRIEADVAEMEAMIAELLELERLRGGRGFARRGWTWCLFCGRLPRGSRIGRPGSTSSRRRRRSGRRWMERRSGSFSETSWRTRSSIRWPTAGRSRSW